MVTAITSYFTFYYRAMLRRAW